MFSVYKVCQSPVTCSTTQDTIRRKPGLLPMKWWCKDLFLISNKLNAISFPAHIFSASVYVHNDLHKAVDSVPHCTWTVHCTLKPKVSHLLKHSQGSLGGQEGELEAALLTSLIRRPLCSKESPLSAQHKLLNSRPEPVLRQHQSHGTIQQNLMNIRWKITMDCKTISSKHETRIKYS